jgi:hypothetical protein
LSSVFFGFWCLEAIGSLLVVALGKDTTATSVAVLIAALAVWIAGLTALILLWMNDVISRLGCARFLVPGQRGGFQAGAAAGA